MSSTARRGAISRRYQFAKLWRAGEEFCHQLLETKRQSSEKLINNSSTSEAIAGAFNRFNETYSQQMSSVMYIAGKSMAPTLNRAALSDPEAFEKVVMRSIPRPSSRSVFVGDVVALKSPMSYGAASPLIIRRVAAMEGEEMVARDDNGETYESFAIPSGECWVLADNQELKPSEAFDSRSFGHVPLKNVVGRIIYAATSRTSHGPVINSPISLEADKPIIEAEVDMEKLQPTAD